MKLRLICFVKNQKGMSLIAVLIFVFVIVSIVVALLSMAGNDNTLSGLQRDSTIALYKAESGIEKALWWLNLEEAEYIKVYLAGNETFAEILPSEYLPEGVESVDISDGPNQGQIKIISEGVEQTSSGKVTGRRKIEVIAEEVGGGTISYDYSLLADNFIALENSASIGGDIHCNGDMKIENEVNVDGNISSSGTINNQGTGTITGSINENTDIVEKPQFDYSIYPDEADYYYNPSEGIGNYGNGVLNEEGTVTIEVLEENPEGFSWDGGETGAVYYIDGNFKIQENGKLILQNAIIIVTGNVTLENYAKLEHIRTGEYDNPVAIATENGNIILENYSEITGGVLRADNGEVKFENSVKLDQGAVVANTIKFEDEGTLINQSGDPDLSYKEGSGVFDKVTWREVY